MPKANSPKELQLSQDIGYQRKFWMLQRIGWVIILLLLLAAGLGLFGGTGPLNRASAENQQLEIQYDPYARRIAPSDIKFTVKNINSSTVQLLVNQDFADKYQIQKIVPQPSDVKSGGDMFIYEFSVSEEAKTASIIFSVKPELTSVGKVKSQIGLSATQLLTINQMVYP